MTDQEKFVAAIHAAPDDDTLRLVYADWLDENGLPWTAGAVRAAVGGDPRWDVRYALGVADECLPGVPTAIAASGGPFGALSAVVTVAMRRGLVAAVRCPVGIWEEHGGRLCSVHPIRSVTFLGSVSPLPPGLVERHPGVAFQWQYPACSGPVGPSGAPGPVGPVGTAGPDDPFFPSPDMFGGGV